MEQNKLWLKFIITGKPQDYLNYKENFQKQQITGGEGSAHYNRRSCNQRNEYKG